MERIKENFGRRIAVIGAAIALFVVSLALAVSFSATAKADPNEDPHNDPFSTAAHVDLTRIIHAPEGSTLDGKFTYTFTKVSYAGIAATGPTDPHMPTANCDVESGGEAGTVTLPLTITDGTISPTTGYDYIEQIGPGIIGTEDTGDSENADDLRVSWPTEAQDAHAYIVQKKLNTIFTGNQAFSGDGSFAWPTAGEYIYTITETDRTGDYLTSSSSASYTLHVYVENDEGTLKATGFVMDQNLLDDGTAGVVKKKDPRQNYGRSNATKENAEPAFTYYRGFTYTSKITLEDQTFYIEKQIKGSYAPSVQAFDFYPEFYYNAWSVGDNIYARIHNIADDTSVTNDVLVQFTVSQVTREGKTYNAALVTQVGGAAPSPENSLPLKGGQRLIFDGTTVSATATSKLPVGTQYGYYEDLSFTSDGTWKGSANTYTGNTAGPVASAETANPHRLTVAYDGTSTPAETPAVATAHITVPTPSTSQENKSVVTNEYTYTPTGFWIDALPYILMIGIPLIAFFIWMAIRRRQLNRIS